MDPDPEVQLITDPAESASDHTVPGHFCGHWHKCDVK
jgi:hypothetical protein